jgi:hypothetical protein
MSRVAMLGGVAYQKSNNDTKNHGPSIRPWLWLGEVAQREGRVQRHVDHTKYFWSIYQEPARFSLFEETKGTLAVLIRTVFSISHNFPRCFGSARGVPVAPPRVLHLERAHGRLYERIRGENTPEVPNQRSRRPNRLGLQSRSPVQNVRQERTWNLAWP